MYWKIKGQLLELLLMLTSHHPTLLNQTHNVYY